MVAMLNGGGFGVDIATGGGTMDPALFVNEDGVFTKPPNIVAWGVASIVVSAAATTLFLI